MNRATEALYLCLDQGGHASRAIVFDSQGNLLAQAFQTIDTQREEGRVEHAPQQIIRSLQAAAEEAVGSLGAAADRIVAAGFATQRSSIVCWHRDSGAALSPVISWQDTRAAQWLADFGPQETQVHEITGLMLSPHYGVSKLRWCLDHLPAVRQAYDNGQLIFGPLASYIVNRMLDSAPLFADPANASRTLLWDRQLRDWSPALLKLFDIPVNCLPASVPSRFEWGELSVAGRQIPVSVVTGDQSAALFAFGVPQKGVAYANLGTGAFIQQSVGSEVVNPGRLLASVVYQDERSQTNVIEGTINGAGSAINALSDQLGLERSLMRANSSRWLEENSELPLFLNGISGLGSPWWLPELRSQFLGDGTAEQKIAAVVESIAFMLTVNLQAMAKVTEPVDTLFVTGGLGAVEPLLQRIANLGKVSVQRPQVTEATARGLAFLLADLPREWPAAEVGSCFEPKTDVQLQDRFRRWCAAMPKISA